MINRKQLIGFGVMAVVALIVIKLLPTIFAVTFSLLGIVLSLAVIAGILYGLYMLFIKGKND